MPLVPELYLGTPWWPKLCLGNSGAGFPACAHKKGDPPGRPHFLPHCAIKQQFFVGADLRVRPLWAHTQVRPYDSVLQFFDCTLVLPNVFLPTVLPVLASLRLP